MKQDYFLTRLHFPTKQVLKIFDRSPGSVWIHLKLPFTTKQKVRLLHLENWKRNRPKSCLSLPINISVNYLFKRKENKQNSGNFWHEVGRYIGVCHEFRELAVKMAVSRGIWQLAGVAPKWDGNGK